MMTSALNMTEKEREIADWKATYQSLVDAKKYLCKDGANHTWLDGSIGIAQHRSQTVMSNLGEQVNFPKELLEDHHEVSGQGKFRFNLPVGNDDSRWFIGTGMFDEAKGEFTGDLALDFEHHWGAKYKDHVPDARFEAGSDANCAWAYGAVTYSGYPGTYAVGAAALPISNVSRLDLDVEVASGFAENTALASAELSPDIVRNDDTQSRPRG